MRVIVRNWRMRLEAGQPGNIRWHFSIGLERKIWSFSRYDREWRLTLLGLRLHWRLW